jgi:uncharacterized protein
MHGQIHWTELNTRNPEAAMAFYGKVAGWTFEPMEMGDDGAYWVCEVDDEPIAGIYGLAGDKFEGVSDHWLSYIAVDNVDAACEAAKEAGATIIRDAWDVEGTGRFAVLKDPGGAIVAWMTPVVDEASDEEDDDDEDEDDDKDEEGDDDKEEVSEAAESDETPKSKEYGVHN